MKHKLFFYGTLMSGFWNHSRMFAGVEITNFGAARTCDKFSVLVGKPAGTIPMLSRTKADGTPPDSDVIGEVFEIDTETLRRVDRLEGHPNTYERTPIRVEINVDDVDQKPAYIEVECYLVKNTQHYGGDQLRTLDNGDYRAYMKKEHPSVGMI